MHLGGTHILDTFTFGQNYATFLIMCNYSSIPYFYLVQTLLFNEFYSILLYSFIGPSTSNILLATALAVPICFMHLSNLF